MRGEGEGAGPASARSSQTMAVATVRLDGEEGALTLRVVASGVAHGTTREAAQKDSNIF